jgi:AmmeMemoRadiSam system protein B
VNQLNKQYKLLKILIVVVCSVIVAVLFGVNKKNYKEVAVSPDVKNKLQFSKKINTAGASVDSLMTQIKTNDTEQFFDEHFFRQGISIKDRQEKIEGTIRGAIVPHHLLASFITADIFERIASQGIQTIILLAPNHQDIGEVPILTSERAWKTSYGEILPHSEVISHLVGKEYIMIDESIVSQEHAIGGLLPFIAYYKKQLQPIQIVPLIIRQNISREQLQDLSQSLASVTNEKTVIVASVDFSHYLDSNHAEENDERTKDAMEGKDYDGLLKMDSAYLDSPQAIVSLLQTMDQLGVESSRILYHTNSGRLFDYYATQTTSYFGIIFVD